MFIRLGQGSNPFVLAPEILGTVFRLEGVEEGFTMFITTADNWPVPVADTSPE